MGYPAGKTKTMPLDLSDVLDRHDPRVRIRTNLAIFWDRIAYTVDEEPAPLDVDRGADRSPRGSSSAGSRAPVRESEDGPHVFLHDDVGPGRAGRTSRVSTRGTATSRELLAAADDRYVVMKGGDAVRLEFDARALPPLRRGMERDYVLVLDGWDKDGDKNTVAGPDGRAAPVPRPGRRAVRGTRRSAYRRDAAERRLREEYLTRPGGPDEFRDALRRRRRAESGRDAPLRFDRGLDRGVGRGARRARRCRGLGRGLPRRARRPRASASASPRTCGT